MAEKLVRKEAEPADVRGAVCAWNGCEATFEGALPEGWFCLLTFWAPYPDLDQTVGEIVTGPFSKRDGVLCPHHSAKLDRLMKDTSQSMEKTVGSA